MSTTASISETFPTLTEQNINEHNDADESFKTPMDVSPSFVMVPALESNQSIICDDSVSSAVSIGTNSSKRKRVRRRKKKSTENDENQPNTLNTNQGVAGILKTNTPLSSPQSKILPKRNIHVR